MCTVSDEKCLKIVVTDGLTKKTNMALMHNSKTAQLQHNYIKELKAKQFANEKQYRKELRDIEQDVSEKECELLELNSELLEISEKLDVVKREMREVRGEIGRTNSDRRVMRKDLFALKVNMLFLLSLFVIVPFNMTI